MSRFIAATAFAGRIYVRGIPDWGPWDPARFDLRDEREVDLAIATRTADRKVTTINELRPGAPRLAGAPARPAPGGAHPVGAREPDR